MPRRRSPHYPGKIRYHKITIPNASPELMREKLNNLPFIGYHVETLNDGRKICITKPGGKQFYGVVKPNDFMVWIYDEANHDRWRISHGEIRDDLRTKLRANMRLGASVIARLLDVCKGAEPKKMKRKWNSSRVATLPGLPVELLLKTYKWIWIQEDCNYPHGEGRWRSMNGILKMRNRMISRRSLKNRVNRN